MATSDGFVGKYPPTLDEFVRDGPDAMHMKSSLSPTHYASQTSFLFDSHGCPTVDFIGHLETFERDMLYILRILNIPELWRGYEMYGFDVGRESDPNVFGTKYRKEHTIELTEEAKEKFYERNMIDFVNFGYSLDPPPYHDRTASYFEESVTLRRIRTRHHLRKE